VTDEAHRTQYGGWFEWRFWRLSDEAFQIARTYQQISIEIGFLDK
jgi:hypothetical protein